jgi:hypothetical protein
VLNLPPAPGAAPCHSGVPRDRHRVPVASHQRVEHQAVGIVQLLHCDCRSIRAISASAPVDVGMQDGGALPEGRLRFTRRRLSAQSEKGPRREELGILHRG